MKITDPQVIQQGEKDLIASVQKDLDLDAVREILKERMAVAALASRGGQIVVHNNAIAFRLDFDISLSGSLLFDREGNLIDEGQPSGFQAQGDSRFHGPALMEEAQEAGPLTLEEDLSLDLTDEDLTDQDLADEDLDRGPGSDILETGTDLDDELELDAEELGLEEDEGLGLDDDSDFDKVLDDENPFDDDDMDADLDDDINDILKESREFWEQKKGS